MTRKVLTGVMSLALGACSGITSSVNSASEATKSLSIGGTFSLLTLRAVSFDDSVRSFATYSVRCVTLSGPAYAGEGQVSSTPPYTFNVSMAAGLNAPIGCFLMGDGLAVATLAFGAETNMSGTSNPKTAYTPRPDSTELMLGTITIADGVAQPAAPVVENGSQAKPSFIDMTGKWSINSVYENANELYIHPCDVDLSIPATSSLKTQCRSQWSAKDVYIHQVAATNSGKTRQAIGIWNSQAALTSCGGKEGITLDSQWTVVGSWPTGNITFAALDLSNLTTDVLSKAKFTRISSASATNCPRNADYTADLPECATANNCNDFSASYPSGERGSMEKLECVLNSLSSGGQYPYGCGDVCGAKAEINWAGLSDPSTRPTYDAQGKGCGDATCNNNVNFNPVNGKPVNRLFFSDLFVDGNAGTGNEVETFACYGATADFRTSLTVTQKTASTATVFVDFTYNFTAGTDTQKDNCRSANPKLAEVLGKVRRMKIELVKK